MPPVPARDRRRWRSRSRACPGGAFAALRMAPIVSPVTLEVAEFGNPDRPG